MPTKEQPVAGEEVGSPRLGVLGYALLCLLVRGPGTGYDLAQRLRRPIGYYWTARHTQIYPELARLVSAGLVTYQAGAGPGPREKKTYTFVERGAGDPAHPMFGNYATLRFGVAVEEQREAWCRWMETMLSEHAS